jgi:hypothetical protein
MRFQPSCRLIVGVLLARPGHRRVVRWGRPVLVYYLLDASLAPGESGEGILGLTRLARKLSSQAAVIRLRRCESFPGWGSADQIAGHVLDCRDVCRGVFGAHATFGVAEDHVHHPVQAVLDGPMIADHRADGVGPEAFADAVRAHWGIENGLHWVLDTVFDEDRARNRKDHGPENLAILRKLALNVLRTARPATSIRRKRKRSG